MGQIVSAFTFRDDDRELAPRPVVGELATRPVLSLGYTQYLVNGMPVDPATIKEVKPEKYAATRDEADHETDERMDQAVWGNRTDQKRLDRLESHLELLGDMLEGAEPPSNPGF